MWQYVQTIINTQLEKMMDPMFYKHLNVII